MQHLGFDPVDVDEIVAFNDPIPTNYGLTFKFNKPFRGNSIAPQMRPMVQLTELAGRKYLQSAHPMMPSFYGINKQTLIAAPDAVMRPLVESGSSSASSPLLDRVRAEPAGSDLFVALDFNAVRPFIQMALTDEVKAKVPPPAQPLLEAINLISAVTLTVNLSQPAPSSLVLHANDEAAAQQLEGMLQGLVQMAQTAAQSQATPGDPNAQAMAQYFNRMIGKFTSPRNGTAVPVFYIDGKNPAQQHLLALGIIAGVGAAVGFQATQEMPVPVATDKFEGQPPTDPAAPPTEEPAP
jgi:hypothetical protein